MKFPFYLFIFFLVICEVFNKNNNVKAMTKCEESNFTECLWTPNKYEVTIFEIGLCSKDPLESVTSTNTDDIDDSKTKGHKNRSFIKTMLNAWESSDDQLSDKEILGNCVPIFRT